LTEAKSDGFRHVRNAGLAFKDDKCRVCGEIVCHSEKMVAFANALEALAKRRNCQEIVNRVFAKKTIVWLALISLILSMCCGTSQRSIRETNSEIVLSARPDSRAICRCVLSPRIAAV
jgi:hypothetical protein